MRTALTSSLVLALTFTSLLACPATPATQQPDNSQPAPQYAPQDNSQQQQQQDPQQQDQQQQQQYPQQQDNSQDQGGGAYQNFSPDQLDNLLSPIALYPDPLLAQVLVAATFPDQVEEAARYVRGSGTNGVDNQDWDVSVRAVAHYPTVIGMMADKIDWTTSLGQAYVNQSTDVSTSVQRLRHLAKNVGNLQTTQQQEVLENDNYIAINPVQPQYIYVPTYDPAIIYYQRPYWGPGITFGIGYPIGGWLNLGFRWGYWGGGFGGVYYTGWNPGGWGRGCWNCGWIGRSRGYVNYRNNVYINNRYTNININRTVINRNVNVNNINRYNYVHKNVNYNNVRANNTRINNRQANNGRPGNNNGRPGGNQPGNIRPGQNNGGVRPGNNVRPGNENGVRPGQNNGGQNNNGRPSTLPANNRPGGSNRNLDNNIGNNGRTDQFRGRDNSFNNNRPANTPQQRPQTQQNRPQPSSGPHAFGRSEGGSFNPNQSQQRGQASRQQSQRPAPQQRSAPQQRGGGGQPRGGGGQPHGGGGGRRP